MLVFPPITASALFKKKNQTYDKARQNLIWEDRNLKTMEKP